MPTGFTTKTGHSFMRIIDAIIQPIPEAKDTHHCLCNLEQPINIKNSQN